MSIPEIRDIDLISSYEKMNTLNKVDPDDRQSYQNLRIRNFLKQFFFLGTGLLTGSFLQMMKLTKKWKDNRRYYLICAFTPAVAFTLYSSSSVTNKLVELDEKYKPLYKEYLIDLYMDEQRANDNNSDE